MATVSNNNIARAIYAYSKESKESEISRNVVKFLARKRLLSQSKDILGKLEKIIHTEENKIVATISTATKLDDTTKHSLLGSLKKRYEVEEVIIREVVDAKLLGGIKIEVGDEVMDFSVRNKIGKLQAYLIR